MTNFRGTKINTQKRESTTIQWRVYSSILAWMLTHNWMSNRTAREKAMSKKLWWSESLKSEFIDDRLFACVMFTVHAYIQGEMISSAICIALLWVFANKLGEISGEEGERKAKMIKGEKILNLARALCSGKTWELDNCIYDIHILRRFTTKLRCHMKRYPHFRDVGRSYRETKNVMLEKMSVDSKYNYLAFYSERGIFNWVWIANSAVYIFFSVNTLKPIAIQLDPFHSIVLTRAYSLSLMI